MRHSRRRNAGRVPCGLPLLLKIGYASDLRVNTRGAPDHCPLGLAMAINWNGVLPQETGKALGSAALCLTALIGAGWALFSFGYTRGKDIGQDELAAYKAASEAKFPEVTSRLLAVDKELRESLKVFDRNSKLEAENASYQKQLAEAAKTRADLDVAMKQLRDELQTAADKESQLRDELHKLTGEDRRFTLTGNKAEFLGEGHTVGLADSALTTELRIIQDNKEHRMSAGNSILVEFRDKRCVLTLVSLRWESPASGDFAWSCKHK
jgi:hypothetical protein